MFASTVAAMCVKLFSAIGLEQELGKRIAESFMLLSVSAFLMTSVDAGTRLARFSWQELIGKPTEGSGVPKKVAYNMYFGTFFVVALAAALLLGASNTAKQLWTIFASANQLLAALTLLSATLWFVKNKKPAWITGFPMVFMLGVSSLALGTRCWKSFTGETIDWVKGGATGFLLTLAIVLVCYGVKAAAGTFRENR